MIYEGSKTMWRQRITMDIYIVRHKFFQVVEIICYSPSIVQEANRIYVSQALFKDKLSPNDLEEKMKKRMEVFIRQKKPLIRDELLQAELDEQVTQYIVSRINLMDSENFEVTLCSQFNCQDDIICEKPEFMEPLQISFSKTSTVSEFHAKLSQFREESNEVKKSYDRAMHALYSDAYHVSNEVIAHVHENYEKKMTWSVPKRRWIRAINKVIFLSHLARVKQQLKIIEDARVEKEGKIVRIKATRKTLDNSQIESLLNKGSPVKLPPVIESVRNQPAPASATVDEKNKLSQPQGGAIQQANRERRRNRHNILQQRRSFDPATSSPSMFDAALQNIDLSSFQSAKVASVLQRADSGRNTRRSLPPLSVEELTSAANRPAPSLINSYRDKSLQAMASIHSLSVSSFDIKAATAATSAAEAVPIIAQIKESRKLKP